MPESLLIKSLLLCFFVGCCEVSSSNESQDVEAVGSFDNPYCIYSELGCAIEKIKKLSAPFIKPAKEAVRGDYQEAAKSLYGKIVLSGRFRHPWCSQDEYIIRLKNDIERVVINAKRWVIETDKKEYPSDHIVYHHLVYYMLDYQMYITYANEYL